MKKRNQEEIAAIETSNKARILMVEESYQRREFRSDYFVIYYSFTFEMRCGSITGFVCFVLSSCQFNKKNRISTFKILCFIHI